MVTSSVLPAQPLHWVRSCFDPSRAEAQSEEVFRQVWRSSARIESTRHPFHREVLDDLDGLLARVAGLPPNTLVEVEVIAKRWEDLSRFHPLIVRRLSVEWMRDFVRAEVADSTDRSTTHIQQSGSRLGRHELTVQHRLSGWRAVIVWRDGEGIGTLVAKSQHPLYRC